MTFLEAVEAWFHSGTTCRATGTLANVGCCLVTNVGCRLPSWYPARSPPDDCEGTLDWVIDTASAPGGGPRRILVDRGGLAAAMALQPARRRTPTVGPSPVGTKAGLVWAGGTAVG
jgi:hypothetical protein